MGFKYRQSNSLCNLRHVFCNKERNSQQSAKKICILNNIFKENSCIFGKETLLASLSIHFYNSVAQNETKTKPHSSFLV